MKNKIFFIFLGLFLATKILASGNIDPQYKFAWGDEIGWLNFGCDFCNVFVSDSKITGFIWSENFGWINLAPENGGVRNDGRGNLSGYAWGENLGWISFNNVRINQDGFFEGEAVIERLGRINFNNPNFKIRTTWRPPEELVWCEKEKRYIPKEEWTKERCEEEIKEKWCEREKRYIPEREWTKERCEEILPPPKEKWCEREKQNIPEKDWSKERCEPIITEKITEKSKEITEKIIEKSKETFETPIGSAIKKILPPLGGIVAIPGLISGLFGSHFVLSNLLFFPYRLISLLLLALGLKKKIVPWGVVYDSVTKQPLDPVYLTLQTNDGKIVAEAITDLDGRYGFLVGPGTYRIFAQKTNYIFPSKKLFGKEKDEFYDNLYFGEPIEVKEGGVIKKNIPMDPEKFDWNEFAKRSKRLLKFHSRLDLWWRRISQFIFILGFWISMFSCFIEPVFYNFLIFGIYLVLYFFKILGIGQKDFGLILEKETGYPLSFAPLRVILPETEKELFVRITDRLGRYYILVPKGEYKIKIEEKLEDGSYQLRYILPKIKTKRGIINKLFKV